MVQVNHFVQRVNSIGLADGDTAMVKVAKNQVVYLALFMSFGGLIWGSLLLHFNLSFAALIPYGYIFLSAINIFDFYHRKNFTTTSIIQIFISMLLPFLLQWQLGGFFASGCVMLWSILSLVGSVILLRSRWVYPNLVLYVWLVAFSYFFDSYFAASKPSILTSETSLALLTLNILLIVAIVFVIAKIKVDRDNIIQEELQQMHQINSSRLSLEQEMRNQLQTSENRYRNLVEESRVLICTHDLHGNLITVNKPGAEILGYSKEEMQGINLSFFLPAELHADYHAYMEHIVKHKTFESFMTVLTKQGDKRVFLLKNTLVSDPGQEPYVMGSAQDVTEWRKSATREERIRKELQMIVSSIDDIVIEFDAARRFKNFWCRKESKLIKPSTYYIGKTLSDAFSYAPAFAEKALAIYEKVILSGKPFSVEIDSGILPTSLSYLIRLNPIIERDGSVKRCTALVSDITARKLSEKKLKEDHALLRTIIDNLPLNVYVKNKFSQRIIVNKAEWQYLGANNENELIGRSDNDLYPYELAQESVGEDKLVLNGQSILGIETISTKNDGTKTHFVISKVPLYDAKNNIIGLVGISVDYTEQKQRELELKKISQELRNAKEEAEESNRLKTIFLGNLSHEVRTPLQGILGFAEILENPKLPELKRKEYLSIIKRRTGDMQNIIESLLDMASLETGEIRAFPVKTNLYEAIEFIFAKLLEDFAPMGKSLKLVLDNKFHPNDSVLIDPQHLLQVLTNLFGNALKFTNQGTITLRCEQSSTNYKVSIIDTGIGIPTDMIDCIFEPFRQAHEGISRSKGGIGLGLSICKKMVNMWGGKIEVISQPGNGSIFSFTVPLKTNSATAQSSLVLTQ
jgi:PAS domain S-box-containing protein